MAALKAAVYPRPRGGTRDSWADPPVRRGLSPPTRGNHFSPTHPELRRGSIPAHAGEPHPSHPPPTLYKVYPRPRGGTPHGGGGGQLDLGLSPPTRGNLSLHNPVSGATGSIPAHAGEPARARHSPRARAVYPRPRGGTLAAIQRQSDAWGLSPPTRGNPALAVVAPDARGSIPAHAGEPRRRSMRRAARTVYPRPRGGTLGDASHPRPVNGLSPPTRGNLGGEHPRNLARRSIPAHAGEPLFITSAAMSITVYPRPRGGTWGLCSLSATSRGLSPPTRGNRIGFLQRIVCARSIPAHAGEPNPRFRY